MLPKPVTNVTRCDWCEKDDLYRSYHDHEWGIPVYDSEALFQKLLLDGAQAGLSWHTILKKREGYYTVFDGMRPEIMATYTEEKIAEILQDPRIIRNKLKVHAFVNNSKIYLDMQKEGIDFSDYLWSFVGGSPIVNSIPTLADIPTTSPQSDAMSTDLRTRGFKFTGSTICYAFMQAVGMVDDHLNSCFRKTVLKSKS